METIDYYTFHDLDLEIKEGRTDIVLFQVYADYTKVEAGKYGFVMIWFNDGYHLGPTYWGQVYAADMEEHAKSWEAKGKKVYIYTKLI